MLLSNTIVNNNNISITQHNQANNSILQSNNVNILATINTMVNNSTILSHQNELNNPNFFLNNTIQSTLNMKNNNI